MKLTADMIRNERWYITGAPCPFKPDDTNARYKHYMICVKMNGRRGEDIVNAIQASDDKIKREKKRETRGSGLFWMRHFAGQGGKGRETEPLIERRP
jgi:hypothetical protein